MRLVMVAWAVCGAARAQSPVERAALLTYEGHPEQALEVLAPAMTGAYQQNPHAWCIMGFAYKAQFYKQRTRKPEDPSRLGGISSFQRCLQLAPNAQDAQDAINSLEALAKSFYQDAYAQTLQFRPGDDEQVIALMGRYEATWSQLHPAEEFTAVEFDLYLRLAQANSALLDPDVGLEEHERSEVFEHVVAHYERALELMPADDRPSYNLAVTWYNEGVRKIRAINRQVTLTELMRIQSECVNYFNRALGFMEAAYAIHSTVPRNLNGLMIIHRALDHREESARFKAELEALNERD
jgi:tetratricopeptide (TPR) repeat protein